ncbi:MAG: metallophosphoesterase [Haloferacaceae archaeon]
MKSPEFAADVDHVHVDERAWDGIYVLGDVHGCPREFDAMVDRLGVTADDLVVVVGDLVRKGPDSAGVVDRVRAADNVLTVRGNNEEKFLTGEKAPADAGLSADQVAWIAAQPAAISFGDALVVHGGVDPRVALDDHTVAALQTTRSLASGYERPFWWEVYDGPRTVFFGHTPLAAPVVRDHAVGLDTGCVYGNQLTAYDYRTGALHAVDPERTHEERAASKFVEPERAPEERETEPLVA